MVNSAFIIHVYSFFQICSQWTGLPHKSLGRAPVFMGENCWLQQRSVAILLYLCTPELHTTFFFFSQLLEDGSSYRFRKLFRKGKIHLLAGLMQLIYIFKVNLKGDPPPPHPYKLKLDSSFSTCKNILREPYTVFEDRKVLRTFCYPQIYQLV